MRAIKHDALEQSMFVNYKGLNTVISKTMWQKWSACYQGSEDPGWYRCTSLARRSMMTTRTAGADTDGHRPAPRRKQEHAAGRKPLLCMCLYCFRRRHWKSDFVLYRYENKRWPLKTSDHGPEKGHSCSEKHCPAPKMLIGLKPLYKMTVLCQ